MTARKHDDVAALAAARRHAEVTATDYVSALLDKARERVQAEGARMRFETADAENLPFADGSFDVVLSVFGVMFTPDQERAAREMLRVVRAGGRIGLANWTPASFIGRLFKLIGTHLPPPAGVKSPALWGTESRIVELFGSQAAGIRCERRHFNFRYRSAAHWLQVFRDFYGPSFADTRVPATHGPGFAVAPDARCISPSQLTRLDGPAAGFVIVGGGKTAMGTIVWLIEQGANPDTITWIRPRDSWLLNRSRVQTDFRFFEQTVGGFAAELEAARDAASIDDLFTRLETAGQLRRIDDAVTPTMYRCAIVSDGELAMLRRLTRVVRMGHVRALEAGRIFLDGGIVRTSPAQVHVHCCANGIPRKPLQPVFQPGRIVPQYLRHCSPNFSAAFIAHLEATIGDDALKNTLCGPVTLPDEPLDWLRMAVQEARNAAKWREIPALRQWLSGCRLNPVAMMIQRAARETTPERARILERFRDASGPVLERLAQLLAESRDRTADRAGVATAMRHDADRERLFIDSIIARAHQHSAGARKPEVSRT